jgi:hypothetical protein
MQSCDRLSMDESFIAGSDLRLLLANRLLALIVCLNLSGVTAHIHLAVMHSCHSWRGRHHCGVMAAGLKSL